MKFVTKPLVMACLTIGLLMPTTSHAWFFFFIPLGLLAGNDKDTVMKMDQEGNWKGMQELSASRLENDQNNASWLYINALSLQKQNNCDEAIKQYKKSIEHKPDFKDPRLNLGICYTDMNRTEEANATFTGLIGLAPEMWQPYYHMGMLFAKLEDTTNARVYLEQLRSRNMVYAKTLDEHIKATDRQLEVARASKEEAERERLNKLAAERAAEEKRQVEEKRASKGDAETRLAELKKLYTKGLITKAVYEDIQKGLLSETSAPNSQSAKRSGGGKIVKD